MGWGRVTPQGHGCWPGHPEKLLWHLAELALLGLTLVFTLQPDVLVMDQPGGPWGPGTLRMVCARTDVTEK